MIMPIKVSKDKYTYQTNTLINCSKAKNNDSVSNEDDDDLAKWESYTSIPEVEGQLLKKCHPREEAAWPHQYLYWKVYWTLPAML